LVRIASIGLSSIVLLVIAFVTYVQLNWNDPVVRPVVAIKAPLESARVLRGKYLYERSMLCWNCHGSQGSHSPAEPQAGGREFDLTRAGPGFGYVYGSNLTPDVETGIGRWSDGELVRAIREGVSRDGHLIFPVMAYQFYHGLSDNDALALVAYIRSMPPVRNEVPVGRLSFAAKVLMVVSLIKAETPIQQPTRSPRAIPSVEYGEYLAWRTSGCAECHTPRDPKTARLDFSKPMSGGLFPFPEEDFYTTGPNLTFDLKTGIGTWTEEQFVTAMQTGLRPNGTVMLPFMPWPAYAQWDRSELHAIWLYLRSLKPVSHQVVASAFVGAAVNARGPARGEAIYRSYCLTCHGPKGSGGPFTNGSLKDAIRDIDDAALTSLIENGLPSTSMPGFTKTLAKDQIGDVVQFVRSW
jgi:mono/diheme cytochrome c family protein